MGYKQITEKFFAFNGYLNMFIDIKVTDPIVEKEGNIVQEHDKYMEEILETIKTEVNYELSNILRPYLKLIRTEIISSYIDLNDRYRDHIGWYEYESTWSYQEPIDIDRLEDVFDDLDWLDNMMEY